MKIRKGIGMCLAVLASFICLSGCFCSQTFQLANEMRFQTDDISEITISYDEEKITFYESDGHELIIREYMTENKSGYYAKVDTRAGSIQISEGGKPLLNNDFSRYVEVYLPSSYHNNLTVTTTDGDIDFSGSNLSLNEFRVNSTAGTVNIGSLDADTIKIETTSGNVFCEKLAGSVRYTSTSGNANIKSAIGFGSYEVSNSGDLNVIYTEVTGDLFFYNKNTDIFITLPSDLEFEFTAAAKNGSISTSFQEWLSVDGGESKGIVGEHPVVNVKAETKNGNIEVKR